MNTNTQVKLLTHLSSSQMTLCRVHWKGSLDFLVNYGNSLNDGNENLSSKLKFNRRSFNSTHVYWASSLYNVLNFIFKNTGFREDPTIKLTIPMNEILNS